MNRDLDADDPEAHDTWTRSVPVECLSRLLRKTHT
jgi:hypothetical protein